MTLSIEKARNAKQSIKIHADRSRNYNVCMVEDLLTDGFSTLSSLLETTRQTNCPNLLVTTPTVASLYGNQLQKRLTEVGIHCSLLVLNCTEANKSLEQVGIICEAAMANDLGRDSFLLALGGGVCTDLVTMAASMFRRGIRTLIGSEGAAAPVCPQNRAYGSVHGSSRKTYPMRNFKPMI